LGEYVIFLQQWRPRHSDDRHELWHTGSPGDEDDARTSISAEKARDTTLDDEK